MPCNDLDLYKINYRMNKENIQDDELVMIIKAECFLKPVGIRE